MICGVCRKKTRKAAYTSYGILCEVCLPGFETNERKLYKELLMEEPFEGPDEFDLDAFERFILKVAVHFIVKAEPEHRARLRRTNPNLLEPRMLSLWIKGKVVDLIPLMYISTLDAEGHEALFHAGTYQFKKKVPFEVIIQAMKKTGFAKEIDE